MISKIASLAFYFGFAIWVFWHFPLALIIAGIASAIFGLITLISMLK